MLIGTLKDNGMRVEVVKESNLLKAKEKFSKIISEHLYSIHKPISDIELLAKAEGGDVKYSAIKCNACTQRNDEEMEILRWGTTARKEISAKIVKESTINVKSSDAARSIAASAKTDKKPIITKKNSDTKKNGLNNFFNKQGGTDEASKSLETKKDTNTEKVENTGNNAIKRKPSKNTLDVPSKKINKGGLNHFFEKSSNQNNAMTVSENADKNQETVISDKNHETVNKEEQSKKEKKEEDTRGKKRNRSQKTNVAAKRRKRIIVQSDSSGSSDSEAQSESEVIQLSPEPAAKHVKPRSPSPPQVKRENGKRKVLKLVNKTYKQGEYIVTKKEHVYVSCSEDEIDNDVEKAMPKPELKTDIKVKKKQTTLTNFFKKS